MKKIRNKYGFSMAELLMVVAILAALFGVAFVAVQRHQRSMTQLEYDTIAKEIFVAAQNHLTAAESQGYLGQITEKSGYGTESGYINGSTSENDPRDKVFYLSKGSDGQGVMLDLMLPFGAIDETIRAGGSYIIRYQPSTARVLDVFYSNPGPVTAWLTLKGADLTGHYDALMPLRGEGNKAARRNCDAIGGAVVGWYGNGDALPVGARLKAPQVLIHNEETLRVEVKDTNTTNTSGALVLVVTGETSEAKKMFNLYSDDTGRVKPGASGEYIIVLDDITREGFHFADIPADTTSGFIPGENITIEAVAYNNEALTNIAYSGKGRTNSIFADPSSFDVVLAADLAAVELNKVNGTVVYDDKSNATNPIGIAAVANFRHLENLDKFVSGWGKREKLVEYISAVQLTNLSDKLSWTAFIGDATEGNHVCAEKNSSTTGSTSTGKYWPVNLEEEFLYDGRGHSISDVVTDGSAPGEDKNVGLFRTLNGGTVQNLELIDFSITGTTSAGALAGSAEESIITNVLVHNSIDKTTKKEKLTENIKSSDTAGGLIGSISGGTVTECAAAVYVSGSTNTGGLIGEAMLGTKTSPIVTACYSGGHTKNGSYKDLGEAGKYDVVGATAGGLIGVSSATIRNSYSTCSVSGTTAGGFVGNAGGSISYCYATGLVSGATTEGAFAGTYSSGTATDCYYYEIINERKDDQKGFTYLDPVDGKESFTGITALDASAQTYNVFSFPNASGYSWQPAVPYDEALKDFYQDKEGKSVYNLKTVKQLVALGTSNASVSINDDDLVATHYGDWPAPEIFIINQ